MSNQVNRSPLRQSFPSRNIETVGSQETTPFIAGKAVTSTQSTCNTSSSHHDRSTYDLFSVPSFDRTRKPKESVIQAVDRTRKPRESVIQAVEIPAAERESMYKVCQDFIKNSKTEIDKMCQYFFILEKQTEDLQVLNETQRMFNRVYKEIETAIPALEQVNMTSMKLIVGILYDLNSRMDKILHEVSDKISSKRDNTVLNKMVRTRYSVVISTLQSLQNSLLGCLDKSLAQQGHGKPTVLPVNENMRRELSQACQTFREKTAGDMYVQLALGISRIDAQAKEALTHPVEEMSLFVENLNKRLLEEIGSQGDGIVINSCNIRRAMDHLEFAVEYVRANSSTKFLTVYTHELQTRGSEFCVILKQRIIDLQVQSL